MADEHQQAVLDNMKRLHLDPKWSDLTIVCEEQEFKVHRNIICPQSDVIEAELSGRFRESDGIIKHDEYDLKTVERMIKYLYTGDYDNIKLQADDDEQTAAGLVVTELPATNSLVAHAHVHALASYYNISKLRIKAAEKFAEVQMVEEEGIVALIETVYKQPKSEDAGLRPAVLRHAEHHYEYLVNNEQLIKDSTDKSCLLECCFELMTQLLNSAATTSAADISQRDETISRLQKQVAAQDRRAKDAEDGIAVVTGVLGCMTECYHCEHPIGVTIGRSGKHGMGKYFVRCTCGTKHKSPH